MTLENLKNRLVYLDYLKTGFSHSEYLKTLCQNEMINIMRQIQDIEKNPGRKDS